MAARALVELRGNGDVGDASGMGDGNAGNASNVARNGAANTPHHESVGGDARIDFAKGKEAMAGGRGAAGSKRGRSVDSSMEQVRNRHGFKRANTMRKGGGGGAGHGGAQE